MKIVAVVSILMVLLGMVTLVSSFGVQKMIKKSCRSASLARLSHQFANQRPSCRTFMTEGDNAQNDQKESEKAADADSLTTNSPSPTSNAAEKSTGPKIFGLSLTDPQDIISLLLYGVIIYNGIDLLIYFVRKLTGNLSE